MRRIRVPLRELQAGERTVDGDGAHYLMRVHRLRTGDVFLAFDPAAGVESEARIVAVDRDSVRCSFSEPTLGLRASLGVTLLQCMGKGDKADEVVRSATALGVERIVLCDSARSVKKVGERGDARRERWEEIALSAAQQCGRVDVPEILGPERLEDALGRFGSPPNRRIVLEPGADEDFLQLVMRRQGEPLVLLVGPEGGLASEELSNARAAGFTSARLGPFALRTELAAVAALAVVVAVGART